MILRYSYPRTLVGGREGTREGGSAAIAVEGSHFSLRNMESHDYILSLNFGICQTTDLIKNFY